MMKKRTTTTPYFKFDAGQFLAETMGLPDAVVGLYTRMMALYWESGCTLPEDEILKMKLGIRTKKDCANLSLILGQLFDADRKHPRLDQCLSDVEEESRKQRDRANKRWNKEITEETTKETEDEHGLIDF